MRAPGRGSRFRSRRVAPAAFVALLVAATLSACAPSADRCLPAPLEATPTEVRAGESVTIESGAAECDLGYDDDTAYSIELVSSSGERSDEVEVRVGGDGRFSTTTVVPDSFPSGVATVVVSGSTYDDCDDDSGSCAVYSTDITVTD